MTDQQRAKQPTAGHAWRASGLVFATKLGTPIEPRNLNRAFAQLCSTAGIRRVRLHDLRHGTATLLRAMDVDLHLVMEVLGHSALAVTSDIYPHIRLDEQRAALDLLSWALTSEADIDVTN